MPGLDPEVAVHKLAISSDAVPVKQSPRRMRLEIEQQVIAETKKLIEAGFIREEKYPTWLANVVPVRKKNGQICVCIDFRDLNKACPKDDFSLPIHELMVDITSSHSIFSFMDGSSGYNQIKMAPEDEKFTAFRTPIGVFCYKVMPFGLKNARATYQRAMIIIFDELIHEQVKCYVDDLVVKSMVRSDHLRDIRIIFERLKKHDLKMNPLKCAFRVSAGKFLGFIVRYRGIEIDPSMIKAIVDLKPPRSLTQLRSFQGKLAFLQRFISNLAGRCHPFAALAKKDARFHWDKNCQEAIESIKRYLRNPPVLAASIPSKPLILYTADLDESLGAILAQENEEGKENALYYLSRRLIPAELKYPAMEKQCLALIFAVQKLRHYMLSHKISLISRVNPLQYLMTRPTL
ncbi:RNA-directed DNA polymerase [Dendrobium catenatum]|uniref:RNA-directed DNA polymerase n=1 Tax=Dendrobium catenatum TaxID=906689 RepID=A0A2I0X620_9ASPA|nr:RNA-directed DNA polymerase [Dendrobium catenatum]